MTDFVEECRREWKRLRVPTGPADEMADDLAADLREAEAEGAFPEEVLGNGASDPRAFAEAWARERGLVRPRRSDTLRTRRALLVGVALVGLLAVGAALGTILHSSHPTATPNATTAAGASTAGNASLHAGLVGSSVDQVRLLPSGINLSPHVPLRHPLTSPPTAIRMVVHNSGQSTIARVTLVVRVARHTITRTVRNLAPNYNRRFTVRLPTQLPARFTLSLHTVRVPGEHNTANNGGAWKIAVRR
jgi:hypothetical protein